MAPFRVEAEAGRTCLGCASERSARQPVCDGSHKGPGLALLEREAETDGRVFFCGCKATSGQPPCAGSHSRL